MDDSYFWAIIENAWQAVGDKSEARQQLAAGLLSEEEAEALLESLEEVIPALREQLLQLSATDLLAFDRVLERKLYDIDRAEIQAYTDGSDDGFLYARGFIVAAGQAYYEAVNAKPSIAVIDLDCEEMCYLSYHIHEEKFGAIPASGISRESCSNHAGWSSHE
jgi:Protein of unknown function (DUF4240)